MPLRDLLRVLGRRPDDEDPPTDPDGHERLGDDPRPVSDPAVPEPPADSALGDSLRGPPSDLSAPRLVPATMLLDLGDVAPAETKADLPPVADLDEFGEEATEGTPEPKGAEPTQPGRRRRAGVSTDGRLREPRQGEMLGRFRLGRELGRGGMGLVIEAEDPEIGRAVAIKVLLDPARVGQEVLSRFVAEARVTGQLEHPSIVPVYEMGRTPEGLVYFVMKRVEGRSLSDILSGLRRGDPEIRRRWTTHRLLNAFAQVCDAVAYAHDRGLLHRDLKPDNIMLGRFGEVLVMDWGIARVMGDLEEAARAQAAGSVVDADAPVPKDLVDPDRGIRTQAGATFGTPGFMSPEQARGKMDLLDGRSDVWSLGAILFRILALRPAFRADDAQQLLRLAAKTPAPDPRDVAPKRPIAEEIAEICLQAMSLRLDERTSSAEDLGRQVRSFLDGSLAREKAELHVVQAERAWSRYRERWDREQSLQQTVQSLEDELEPWRPLEDKAELFAARAELRATVPDRLEAFGNVVAACEQALAQDPAHSRARRLLALAFWDRLREAEEGRDDAEARYYRSRVFAFDDGRFVSAMAAGGRLTLRTDPTDAEVWCRKVDTSGLVWKPGESRLLGRTPLLSVPMGVGSYVLTLRSPGRRDAVYPVFIEREAHWDAGERPIPLYRDEEIGPGYVYVPSGPFQCGGDAASQDALPRSRPWIGGLLMAQRPVALSEYCEFLNAELERDPEVAWQRVPRQESGFRVAGGQYWARQPAGGRYELPDRDRDGDSWDPDWPVIGVSWHDAQAYAEWLSASSGATYRLPTELEWEKSARGVDGRIHPWGDSFDAALCKMRDSRPGRPLPEPAGSFPSDVSVYGVQDLAGGARDWCRDARYNGDTDRRPVRGGSWDTDPRCARSAYRIGFDPWRVRSDLGFRLVKVHR